MRRTFVPLLAVVLLALIPASAITQACDHTEQSPALAVPVAVQNTPPEAEQPDVVQPVLFRPDEDAVSFKHPFYCPDIDKLEISNPIYRPGMDRIQIYDLGHQSCSPTQPGNRHK